MTVNKTQQSTVITVIINIPAVALQILCSSSLIIQERGFGMTAQGQVTKEENTQWLP